jgi:hypothetical protein
LIFAILKFQGAADWREISKTTAVVSILFLLGLQSKNYYDTFIRRLDEGQWASLSLVLAYAFPVLIVLSIAVPSYWWTVIGIGLIWFKTIQLWLWARGIKILKETKTHLVETTWAYAALFALNLIAVWGVLVQKEVVTIIFNSQLKVEELERVLRKVIMIPSDSMTVSSALVDLSNTIKTEGLLAVDIGLSMMYLFIFIIVLIGFLLLTGSRRSRLVERHS